MSPIQGGGGGAGGGGGGLAKLFETTLAAPAATIDTGAAGIAQTSTHLLIVAALRSTDSGTRNTPQVQFNGDTTAAHYGLQNLTGASSTAGAAQSNTLFAEWPACPTSTADAGSFGVVWAWIPLYTSTSINKSMVAVGGAPLGTASASWESAVFVSMWLETTAINQILVQPQAAGNWATGSYLGVFGV